jgi:hypothetical protein
MSCCDKTLKLPFQDYCQSIELPLIATIQGVYEIRKQNRKTIAMKTFDVNDPIIIDNVFNENEIITLQVIDPNGDIVTDAHDNDCFRIQIIPNKNINLDV